MKIFSMGSLAVLLCGCASTAIEYQAKSANNPWGYEERLQEDGSYILSVALPAYGKDGHELSFAYWERRAGELCGEESYEKNIYKARRPTLVTTGAYVQGVATTGGGSAGAYTLEGTLTCKNKAS